MHPAHQLPVGNDAAAHAGADNEHRRVAAALQGTVCQLCHGGGLAVVFQYNGTAALFRQQLPHRGGGVVQQRPAVGHIAGAVIHKARQRHGNAGHLVFVGRIQPVKRIQKLRLCILRRGHCAAVRAVHLLVHDRVFDLGAAYIKNHNFHLVALPQTVVFCPYYGKSSRESKAPAVKIKTAKIVPACGCNPPRPVIS